MFWDIFYTLCKITEKSPNSVCKELGFSNATATKWKNGATPKGVSLKKIADYFQVSADYLLTGENPDGNAGMMFTVDREALKRAIDKTASIYPKNAEPADRNARTPVNFWGKVSAGIGAYAEGIPLRAMAADDEDMIDGYEYAWLEVEGDSMYPELRDGDYILARIQDTAESGDMVVAIIDDGCESKGFVKRVEIEENNHLALISTNPAYPPKVFVGDRMNDVRIFGKVVSAKRKF